MAMIWNKIFMILKSALTRTWIVLPCLSLIMLQSLNAQTKDSGGKIDTDNIKTIEKQLGPFKINKREFTLILKIMKYQGALKGFDETVESFSIVDEKGEVHYHKSFDVAYGNGRFDESLGIQAYVLDRNPTKGFRYESGKLNEIASKGQTGAGLILYYGVTPSAPSSGVSCQVFTLKGEHLVPLFSPLTVYGQVYDLARGSHPNALKLFAGNTMKFGVWTGWFEVIVPIKVLDKLRIVPLHYYSSFGYKAFNVVVERRYSGEETFVRFFSHPDISSIPQHVVIKKDTKIKFLFAYARISIITGDSECVISVDEMPWLKLRIDGKEGFVRDAEDLLALGIHPAG